MYIRCVFLVAPLFNRWLLNPFSLCSKEQRNVCIPSQGSCLPRPPQHLGRFAGYHRSPLQVHSPHWLLPAGVHTAVRKASLALSISAPPTISLCQSQHPPSHSASQFSKLSRLKINPTKREKKKKGGEDCRETNQPPVPQTLQPKEHKCQQRGESCLLAGAQL